MRSGVRWAETTVSSKGTSNSSSISPASFMTARSLSLPIIIPTRGVLILLFLFADTTVAHFDHGLLLRFFGCLGCFFGDHLQGILDLMRLVYKILFFAADDGHMAHLSAGFGVALTIDVDEYIVHLQHFFESFIIGFAVTAGSADEIDDGAGKDGFGIAQGITQDHTPQHIELGAIIGFYRMVPAVVDTGGGFVDKDIALFGHEKLDGEDAGALELFDD